MKNERQKKRDKKVKERKKKRKGAPNPKLDEQEDEDNDPDDEDTHMTNCVQHIMLDAQHLLYPNPNQVVKTEPIIYRGTP